MTVAWHFGGGWVILNVYDGRPVATVSFGSNPTQPSLFRQHQQSAFVGVPVGLLRPSWVPPGSGAWCHAAGQGCYTRQPAMPARSLLAAVSCPRPWGARGVGLPLRPPPEVQPWGHAALAACPRGSSAALGRPLRTGASALVCD
jgi:hypothetical protein